jgi:sporulation protein YlmC with PRC-barrel domain
MDTRKIAVMFGVVIAAAAGSSRVVSAQLATPEAIPFISAQPANEWLARVFIGAKVKNATGETIGDVNDLMFDKTGRISTVVLGIGGFLGVGEKDVAVPFNALAFTVGTEGQRIIIVPLSKDALNQAPLFKATEKTALDAVEEKAVELGKKASEKAGQLKDQAIKKIDDMQKGEQKKP